VSYTVSDLIVETLERAGVRRVYGIPGDSGDVVRPVT